jgi:exopolysaccharide biosynthesis polyprenyl glycosylphosphotransferase
MARRMQGIRHRRILLPEAIVSIHESVVERAAGAEIPVGPDAFAAAFAPRLPKAANRNLPSTVDGTYASLKRGLDLVVAFAALFLFAPVLAVIAALVALDSSGPVLFRQTRLGLGGQPFDIFKFRTMTVMENGDVIRQASRADARITRIGHFLRAFSLDELPQILNVIRGDMSIIGPRPHARAHDEMYARLIDCYALRQNIKPGITGWAQVNGLRGETPTLESMRRRVDFDLWYVNNANIALDIEILFRTVAEVFRSRNAF